MADEKRKRAPADGPDGIDKWGTNGYGLIVNGKKVKPVPAEMDTEEVEEIEEKEPE